MAKAPVKRRASARPQEPSAAVNNSGIGKRRSAAKLDGKANYQKRRKEIMSAAAHVFNRLGYQGTSIGAVAKELDIDRASLYYYISSKEELFDDIVRDVVKRNVAIAQRIQKSAASPPDKLRELIVALMTSYGEHYPLIYIYLRENLSQAKDQRSAWSKQMKKLNHDYEKSIIAIIDEGYADGSMRDIGSSTIVAYAILGIINWTHRWFRPEKSTLDAAQIGAIFAELVPGGLLPPESRKR